MVFGLILQVSSAIDGSGQIKQQIIDPGDWQHDWVGCSSPQDKPFKQFHGEVGYFRGQGKVAAECPHMVSLDSCVQENPV